MIDVAQLVEFELLSAGGRLWKSVECDGTRGRWVVYANLKAARDAGEPDNARGLRAQPVFAESAEIIRRVLDNRLNARDWIAAVLCGERLSYTIRPD
jgi:hypothetical protein